MDLPQFEGALRAQTIHSCLDAFDCIVRSAQRPGGVPRSGPKWPANLILGEGRESRLGNGNGRARGRRSQRRKR